MSGKKIKNTLSGGLNKMAEKGPVSTFNRKLGIGDGNFFKRALQPGEMGLRKLNQGVQEGGARGGLDAIGRGDVTDPGGMFHDMSGPIPDPGAAPGPGNISAQAGTARDRVRRQAYRAQGRRSTIRTQGLFGAYTGNQSQLLGS